MKRLLLIVVAFAALTGLLMGFDLSIIAVVLNPIQEIYELCPPNQYSCFKRELFVSMIAPGALLGSLLGGTVADVYGRRLTLVVSDIFFMVGSFGFLIVSTYVGLLVSRAAVGVGVGIGFVVFATYVTEISPAHQRGQLVLCQEVAQCIGVLLTYLVAALVGDQHWRAMLAAGGVVAFFQLGGVVLLPESPRWLTIQRRTEEAFKVMRSLGIEESAASLVAFAAAGSASRGDASLRTRGDPSTSRPYTAKSGPDDHQNASYFYGSGGQGAHSSAFQPLLGEGGGSRGGVRWGLRSARHLTSRRSLATTAALSSRPVVSANDFQRSKSQPALPHFVVNRIFTAEVSATSERAPSVGGDAPRKGQPDGGGGGCVVTFFDSPPLATAAAGVFPTSTATSGSSSTWVPGATISRKRPQRTLSSSEKPSGAGGFLKTVVGFKKQVLTACFVGVAQNLLCTNSSLYYSTDLMLLAGVCRAYDWGVGLGIMKMLGTILVFWQVDKLGRRKFLLWGTAGLMLTFLGLSKAYSLAKEQDFNKAAMFCRSAEGAHLPPSGIAGPQSVLALIGLLLFVFFWEISWAGLMYVVASEILPSNIRGIGMGLVIFCFWLSLFTSQLLFEFFFRISSVSRTFAGLAIVAFAVMLMTYLSVPDMTNKSLEEISTSMMLPNESNDDSDRDCYSTSSYQGGTPLPPLLTFPVHHEA